MIFKNNEKYTLTEKDEEFIRKMTGNKWPVRFVFAEGAFTPNPNTEDPKRVDRPPFVIIPFEESIGNIEEGQSVKWNYTEFPPKYDNKTGRWEYYENGNGALKFDGSFSVQKDRRDLAFFLLKISKMSEHNPESKRKLIKVYNKEALAQAKIESAANRVTVEGLILGQMKLDLAEIRRIAKAMGMGDVDDMDEPVLRVELLEVINNREKVDKDGYTAFLELSENEYRKTVLEAVTEAVDLELVKWHPTVKKWILYNKKGEKVEELCKIVVGKSTLESLQIRAIEDEKVAETIVFAVKEYKQVVQTA